VNFEIQQETLQKSLDLVAGVVPGKTTLPILTCVLVEADDDGLRLSATNLDISVVTRVSEVEVAKQGKAAVPSGKLVSFVRSLAPGAVQVKVEGGKCTLRAGKASFEEACMNAEEYPKLPEVAAGEGLTVPGKVLAEMIAETSYSVSRDETRPALMGILWEVRKDGLIMVATDAHRLARSFRAIDWSQDDERDLIVDTGGLRHLPRITGGADTEETEVYLGENQLSFRAGPTLLHTRLLEGPFPEYSAVIPKNNDKLVVIDRDLLAQAIRRVSITADRITSQIRLGLESGRLERVSQPQPQPQQRAGQQGFAPQLEQAAGEKHDHHDRGGDESPCDKRRRADRIQRPFDHHKRAAPDDGDAHQNEIRLPAAHNSLSASSKIWGHIRGESIQAIPTRVNSV